MLCVTLVCELFLACQSCVVPEEGMCAGCAPAPECDCIFWKFWVPPDGMMYPYSGVLWVPAAGAGAAGGHTEF